MWGRLARTPRLYRLAAWLGVNAMGLLGKRRKMIRFLPLARGWFQFRDLPVPARKSFQAQWRARKK